MKIYPYKKGLAGCRALAETLGCLRVNQEGGMIRGGNQHRLLINWGRSTFDREVSTYLQVLNQPDAVASAVDKRITHRVLRTVGVPCPLPLGRLDARERLEAGARVVSHHNPRSTGGNGLVVLRAVEELDRQPEDAYLVAYLKKTHEYRVHVAFGEVLDVQRKARRRSVPDEEVNWEVRNLANGFVFVRDMGESGVDEAVCRNAVAAVDSLGLDFGAVDVGFHEPSGSSFVLEVNTAPGLEGTTVNKYAEAFSAIDNQIREV